MTPPITFGKYLLLERINVGGMAEVFKAKAFGVEGFTRILAIKRILPNMADDDEFINMFVDEARIAVQLAHANIVQIYELGKFESQYYIAMEYVSGKDLRQILDRMRKKKTVFPVSAAAYVTSKVCEGLDYAHRRTDPSGKPINLIHRDVSPQNILVSYEGAVKVTDFGIAKAEDRASKTQAGVLKGKFGYMSPEQVRGLEIDQRSDIFAVGILMYEMLTGKRLFLGESDFSTLEKVRHAEVAPPSQFNPAITPELERIMLKALAREREERYQWASELLDDLQQFLIENNTIYNAKRLSQWLKTEYQPDIDAEAAKMEEFMRLPPPSNPEALQAARDMVNAPRHHGAGVMLDAASGEKTMIFESALADLASAPTQLGESLFPEGGSKPGAPRPSALPVDGSRSQTHRAEGRSQTDRVARERMDTPRLEAVSVPVRSVRKSYVGWVVFAVTSVVSLLILLGALYFASGDKLGTLQVSTNLLDEQFEIFLDDVFVANTSPYIRTDLKPGAYRLEVRPKVGSAKSYEIEVVPGSPAFVSAEFEVASPTRGTIEITSEPAGASVLLNGAEIGVTPLTLRDQTTTTSVAVLVRRDGFEPFALNVGFTPGSTLARAHCQLKPLRDSGSTQAPTAAPARSQVTIQTSPPGAAIYIDGERRGEAPLTITDLAPGRTYVAQARKAGFKTTQKMFKVEAKGLTALALELEEATGTDSAPGDGATKTLATKQGGNATPTKQVTQQTPTKVAPTSGGKTSCGNVDDAILAANYTGEANCEVFVNNRRIGAVPMFREAAPSGRCEVRFQCPSGKVLKKVIDIKPKVHTRILVENNEIVAR